MQFMKTDSLCTRNDKSVSPHPLESYADAVALFERGMYDLATANLRQVIEREPRNFHARCLLGTCLQRIGRDDEAARAFAAALKIVPDHPEIIASLALALTRIGKKTQALICFEKALTCQPEDYSLHNQYATVLEKCNRLVEARQAIKASLDLRPGNYGAMVNLATIEYREGNHARAHSLIAELDLSGRTYEAAAMIKHIDGLALDKLGRYEEAYACFKKSNQLDMQTPAYKYLRDHHAADLKNIAALPARFPRERISSWKRPAVTMGAKPPVFLVGFPRSGTTLMEQVLSAHPQVYTLDERSPLGVIAKDFLTKDEQIASLDDLSDEIIDQYRRQYFESLQNLTGCFESESLLVDKLPLNILYLPLIYRFFPDSKVIVALRHPLDCIISNYIQRYKLNKKMMNFLSLDNTARFYDVTMGMYLQFRQTIPLPMHEIKYESLIEAFEDQTRDLAAFLELAWSPEMRQYHHKAARRVINTPSYTEVIKPIHRKAAYRWRNYQKPLADILPCVQRYIDEFGYDPQA